MRPAQIVLVWLFLPTSALGALVMSASATVELFTSQGVSGRIAWAAVLMLEVTALAGTLLWVLVGNRSLRRDATVVTVGATGLALVAGVYSYGPVGAAPGLMLVALTHLASRAWREPWSAAEPVTVPDLVDDRQAAGVTGPGEPGDGVGEPGDHHLPAPPPLKVAPTPVDHQDDQIVARARRLVEQGAGRTVLRRELAITEHRARRLLAEVRQA